MSNVIAVDAELFVTVSSGGELVLSDTLPQSGAVATLLDITQTADVNEHLSTLAAWSDQFEPLPSAGASLTAGDMYRYGDGVVIVRQSHTRTEHDPADVPALFLVAREPGTGIEWIVGESVEVGTQRTYGGTTYQAVQAHVTQADWTPDSTPALWQPVGGGAGEWQAGTAYAVDDEVTYGGTTYRCRQAHTAQVGWEPPNVLALWLPI